MKKDTEKVAKLQKIIELEKVLNNIQDSDILLERILTEARTIVHADAGSIYVVENDTMRIRYVQNATQQKSLLPGQKLPISYFTFRINEKSISGYTALTGEILNVHDAYNIPPEKPYSFNKEPDKVSGYRTKSMMTVPLQSSSGKTLGVIQIINAQNSEGEFVHFTEDDELYIKHFANSATQALQRTYLTRSMVLRMIQMAGFRDPKETGAHVNRVANYAVEIYDHWAFKNKIPVIDSERFRDTLKIASMLHDVGKVAISDLILKKPAKLDEAEFKVIQSHTIVGSQLFTEIESPLDSMSRDVALRHHERWDGKGYPGKVAFQNGQPLLEDFLENKPEGLKGEEIPLAARIVSIADVFDALSSRRAYKPAWSEDDVLKEIQSQAGLQFDPEIVDCFLKVYPSIKQIQMAWPDTHEN